MLNRYTKSSRKWNWLFWSRRYHGAICWKDSWERRPQATMTHRINGSAGGIWREKRRMPQPGTWIGNTVFLAYDTPKQIFNEILARPTGWKSGLKHQLSAQISLFVYKKKKWEANAHQVKKGNTWLGWTRIEGCLTLRRSPESMTTTWCGLPCYWMVAKRLPVVTAAFWKPESE